MARAKVKKIITNYPPIENIELSFFKNITVIGGSSGSGKTFVLSSIKDALLGCLVPYTEVEIDGTINTNKVVFVDELRSNFSKPTPLGSGLLRQLRVAMNDKDIVLIDYADYGLDTKLQYMLCEIIDSYVKQYNTQFIITTHSPIVAEYFNDSLDDSRGTFVLDEF